MPTYVAGNINDKYVYINDLELKIISQDLQIRNSISIKFVANRCSNFTKMNFICYGNSFMAQTIIQSYLALINNYWSVVTGLLVQLPYNN